MLSNFPDPHSLTVRKPAPGRRRLLRGAAVRLTLAAGWVLVVGSMGCTWWGSRDERSAKPLGDKDYGQIEVSDRNDALGDDRPESHVRQAAFGKIDPSPELVIEVNGQVQRPGRTVGLLKGQRVTDAVRAAGGLTLEADPHLVELVRPDPTRNHEEVRFAVDLYAILFEGDSTTDVVLQAGDRLEVPIRRSTGSKLMDRLKGR